MLTAYSHAKINLRLEVLGRRPDGYHDICSVFQTVSLRDRLTFTARRDGRIVLLCDDPSIPSDGRNLVVKAAEILKEAVSRTSKTDKRNLGSLIRLYKRIPSGAGLGGGSSNAAVTLRMLSKLWNINVLPRRRLEGLAADIGSDVPYFLTGGTCLVTGRGEKVKRLSSLPRFHLVLVFPGIHVSTAWAYARLRMKLTKGPECSKIMERGFRKARSPAELSGLLANDMESAVIPSHPIIERAKSDLASAGALNSLMSGSGSAVFGIFGDRASARKAWRSLSRRWPGCHLAESVAST